MQIISVRQVILQRKTILSAVVFETVAKTAFDTILAECIVSFRCFVVSAMLVFFYRRELRHTVVTRDLGRFVGQYQCGEFWYRVEEQQ